MAGAVTVHADRQAGPGLSARLGQVVQDRHATTMPAQAGELLVGNRGKVLR